MTLPLIAIVLGLAQATSTAPVVVARTSTTNVSIGERFQVTVEARGPGGISWEFPGDVTDGSTELTPSRSPAATASTAIYDAQVFVIGKEARVPEIEVQYKLANGSTGKIKSAPVPLNVVSAIDANDANPAPADFAPPQPVLVSRAFWIASTVAGLLLLTGIVLLVRRLKFPKKPESPISTPALSPEEAALTALEGLASSQSTLDAKAFYIRLVQILKQYLEIRLEAPILEMTSAETLTLVKAHTWTAPHALDLRDLVSSADLAKFSGVAVASNADRQIQLVRSLVGRLDRLRRAEQDSEAREADRRRPA